MANAQGYSSPPTAMAAARPVPVDLLGEFDDEERIPWKLSIKNVVKLKLYADLLFNRKSYELWMATLRAELGPYAIFLDRDMPSVEEWCASNELRHLSPGHGEVLAQKDAAFTAREYVKFQGLWRRRAKLVWNAILASCDLGFVILS